MATLRINSDSNENDKEALVPVVDKDQVIVKKKTLSQKFADAFISDSAKDVGSFIWRDKIIPGIKETALECLEMIFFGGTSARRGGTYRRTGAYTSDITPYRAFYDSEYGAPPRRSRRERSRYIENDDYLDKIDYRNIIVRDRSSAEEIVRTLRGRIEKYGEATKSDLLELVDLASNYQDRNWGWTNPNDIGIRRVSSGYLIDVSDAKFLD